MLIGGVVAGLIFVALLIATGAVNHRDRTRLRDIREKILARRQRSDNEALL